uniref:Uncharacterized protein n=1 Tax=Athene cunicularia TaxID=194338 RepID=A0A663NAV7_ATHCN
VGELGSGLGKRSVSETPAEAAGEAASLDEVPAVAFLRGSAGRGAASLTSSQLLGLQEEEQKPAEPPVKVEEPPVKSPDVITEKKVVKITSEISQMERMQKRAERFNVPVSLESKKAARAARFGLATVSTKGEEVKPNQSVNMDKLKERAQRFGLNVSSLSKKGCDRPLPKQERINIYSEINTTSCVLPKQK